MAHFARIENGHVTQVIVVNNAVLENDGDFPESEASGQAFIASIGLGGEWLQTSYNASFRGNYAAGCTYDAELDAFIRKQPYASWTLNTETFQWEAPIPYPNDGFDYQWDEEQGDWIQVVSE